MVFVELTPFVAFREAHWDDEDLRRLQGHLLTTPDAGDVIPGAGGVRKLRWQVQGRGKRGGARVIYFWRVAESQIFLIYGYVKSRSENLSAEQVTYLARLTKELKQHG
jgi:putative component of toxin-antitoxin plasmid stabilization module